MKNTRRWIGLFLFVLFLTSCEAGAVEVGITPSPTDVPPTARAASPTLPPTATGTTVPTSSLTLSPTTAPSPTATITASPSKAAGQKASATPYIEILPSGTPVSSADPCLNILYPLSTGRLWKYKLFLRETDNIAVISVTGTGGDAASVDLLDQSTGTHSSTTVHCAGGALSGFSMAEIGFLFFPSGASLKTQTTSGLLAPSEEDLEESNWDYAWNTGLLASGLIFIDHPYLGEVELDFEDAPVQIEWQTAGAGEKAFESVTSPAGTFPRALKVKGKAVFQLMVVVHLGYQDQEIPAILELVSTLWYQPHVGLVKQVFDSSQVIINDYSCPADIASGMELLEYNFSP